MIQTTDIEQANRWIYSKLAGNQQILDTVGLYALKGTPQIYYMSSPEGNKLSARITITNGLIAQNKFAVSSDAKFVRIPVGLYRTNLGNQISVNAVSNIVNGTGTLNLDPSQNPVGSGEFFTLPTPQIVFRYLSGNVKRGTGGRKIFSKLNYAIKAICAGDSQLPILGIATIVEQLFQQSQLENDAVSIGCSIVQPINYDEILDDGTHVFQFGHQIELMTYNTFTQLL